MEAVREKKRTKQKKTKQRSLTSAPDNEVYEIVQEPTASSSSSRDIEVVTDTSPIEIREEIMQTEEKFEEIEDPEPTAPLPDNVESLSAVPVSEIRDLTLTTEDTDEPPQICDAIPSAPPLSELDFYQIQQINRAILDDIQRNQPKIKVDPSVISLTVPYSEIERNQLYYNSKLDTVLDFETQFPQHFARYHDQMRHSQLYRELDAYFKVQCEIHNLKVDVGQLKDSFPKIRGRIWTVFPKEQTFTQVCCSSTVKSTVRYISGTYNENWALSFRDSLMNFAKICCDTMRGKVFLRNLQVLTISALVQDIIDRSHDTPQREELRVALTTLFHFVVKKTTTRHFKDNMKTWLEQVLIVLNGRSLLEDQLFLMSHVLRCPTEVAVQVVKTVNIAPRDRPVNAELINEWLALMWMCLRPVQQWHKSVLEEPGEKDTNWAIVDSDGEDTEEDQSVQKHPNESLFLEILDRLPLATIFETWLDLSDGGLYTINTLRFVLFSSSFVQLITEGLKIYQEDRYKTFLKRLAGIVKWNAELVTGVYDLYKCNDHPKEGEMLNRLATEYNMFICLVCKNLASNRSVLQYLSQLNYSRLEPNTLWMLAYYLLTRFPDEKEIRNGFTDDFRRRAKEEFNLTSSLCTISDWTMEELYFILETLSVLAMSGPEDPELVDWIIRTLFQIGFVLKDINEKCYKFVKDLLATVALRLPSVIEIVLREVQVNQSLMADRVLQMLKGLPFHTWHPDTDTLDVIAFLMENYELESPEHSVAKLVISYLNWDFSEPSGLALGHEFHSRAALLVLGATVKKFPNFNEFKKISLTDVDPDPRKRYVAWAWKMITKLKLHSMDQGAMAQQQKMENNCINVIPVMKKELIPGLKQLTDEEKHPLATYVSLLMCDIGNDSHEVLTKGLPNLIEVLDEMPGIIVIRCVDLIVPLFLNATDDLITSKEFGTVLDFLLTEEKSLLGIQLTWRSNELIGQFADMVTSQMLDCTKVGVEPTRKITWFWLMLLTRHSNWSSNSCILTILERILSTAVTIPDLFAMCREFLNPQIMELKLKQANRKLFIQKTILSYPGLGIIFLESDFIFYERDSGIWKEIVSRLATNGDRQKLQAVVRELTNEFTAAELSVFRWSEFVCGLDTRHWTFSVALVQYYRLVKDAPFIRHLNAALNRKLETASKSFESDTLKEDDTGLKRMYKDMAVICSNVALGREIMLNAANAFHTNFLYMPTLRETSKSQAENWKVLIFRQAPKRRNSPLQSAKNEQLSLSEKRAQIFETLKQQSVSFSTTEVKVTTGKDTPREAIGLKNLLSTLRNIKAEYTSTIQSVERQKQLEFQLYIENLVQYGSRSSCKTCHSGVLIHIRYKELIKSSENGNENLQQILRSDVDDTSQRDDRLVNFFDGVLEALKVCVRGCQEGHHTDCPSTLERCLRIYSVCDETVQFEFIAQICEKIKYPMKIIMRRHSSQFSTETVDAILKNPLMMPILMDVLDPDDRLYLRVLRRFFNEGAKKPSVLLSCLPTLEISVWASRSRVTESYRISIIKMVFEYLKSSQQECFEILANEIFVVMLRHIHVLPNVLELVFDRKSCTTALLLVLLKLLGLARNPNTLVKTGFEQILERSVPAFTFEAVEWACAFLSQNGLPNSTAAADTEVFVHFMQMISYLIISTNSSKSPENLHTLIATMYERRIAESSVESAKLLVECYFKVLLYIPEECRAKLQLKWYIHRYFTLSDSVQMIDKHKLYARHMRELSWQKFVPSSEDFSDLYSCLTMQSNMQKNTGNASLCQSVISHVIVKLDWTFVKEQIKADSWDSFLLSRLLFVAIRISYELPETSNEDIIRFYDNLGNLPWITIREAAFNEALNWIVLSYPQKPLVSKLSCERDSVENRMLDILFKSAGVKDCNAIVRDDHGDIKTRRLCAAVIRLFCMSSSHDPGKLQEGLRAFLRPMTDYFDRLDPDRRGELQGFQRELLKLLDDKILSGHFLSVLVSTVEQSDDYFISSFLKVLASTDVTLTKSIARFWDYLIGAFFQKCTGNNLHPWRTIEELSLGQMLKLRLDHLKEMHLYLLLSLFINCKLKICTTAREIVVFLDDLTNWLPNVTITEKNESQLLLLWTQLVCYGASLYFKFADASILEKSLKYLKVNTLVRADGWGKTLFNAIGLAKMAKEELCIRFMIYLIIKCFPKLRESSLESSAKFSNFETDSKSAKMSNFKTQLDDLYAGNPSIVPDRIENFAPCLIRFIRTIISNTECSEWFKNVEECWRLAGDETNFS